MKSTGTQLGFGFPGPPKRKRRGRPRGDRVSHGSRPRFAARFPLHVTMRVREGVPRLRRGPIIRYVRLAILRAQRGALFRVCEFSLLSNHMHLICEASSAEMLARGMQGLAVRIARGVNRVAARRGTFFSDRYHLRVLRTPREVRGCVAYVLQNARKHAAERRGGLTRGWVDPYSSGPWFEGWVRLPPRDEPWMREVAREPRPTVRAETWLLNVGWKRWGLLDLDETPGRSGRSHLRCGSQRRRGTDGVFAGHDPC